MNRILLLAIAGFAGLALTAQQQFSAIYQPSDAEVRVVTTLGWDAFLADHASQQAAGFRLTDIETYKEGGDERSYVGIYTESPLRDSVGMADSWARFIKLKRKMVKSGYTMVDVAAVTLNESDANFYGVWVKEAQPSIHKVWLLDSRETIIKKTQDMAKDRFKIKRVHVLDVPNGEPSFVVLYHFSPVDRFNFLFFADTLEEIRKEATERKKSKVQLIDFDRFREGNTTQYVAIFQDGEYDSEFVTAVPIGEIDAKAISLKEQRGLKLINLSVD
ncbi:hypothetical protein [Neolewinella persica]|uniref:hypothetical protein n=1 Tax=Neolewinella persica TaxID=70998 RepID=UPI0003818531|nr:hypothetical protein [Neolewinella persica]